MRFICLFFLVITLTSCMVGPDFESPEAPAPSKFTEKPLPCKTVSSKGPGGESQYFRLCQEIPNNWWSLFHSEALNFWVKRGLANSPNIEAAIAALKIAQENYNAASGALYPTITLTPSALRQRFSLASIGAPSTAVTTFSLYNVSVNVTYLLDVFGGTRRNMEAFNALVDYQYYQLEGAYLSLAANISTTVITEASLREQIRATHDLIKTQEDSLSIVKKQLSLGGVSKVEVLAQEAQLAGLKATLPPLEKNLAQTRNALAALVGSLPSEACLPAFSLASLKLPQDLPVSLPSDLVRQRPDVQAAEAILHQASANVGVAIANMLPQVNLTGSFGTEASDFSDLFKSFSNVWSYGISPVQTLFQGGTLNAKRKAAIATYEQACARYKQTVLLAFQNVADSLNAIEIDAENLRVKTEAETVALQSLNITRAQYKLGALNYLALLNAERQYNTARIARIQAEALRFTNTVALFQALGGGWWNCEVRIR